MDALERQSPTSTSRRPLRLGSVSYLNAKPLIWGLENDLELRLMLDVPSRLLAGLRDGRFDVALLPVIDYQRLGGLRIVPAGGIGCDGPTLTVRIFSRVPVQRITRLACDTDSHTSVALARVVLGERFGIKPEFLELSAGHGRTRWGDGEVGRWGEGKVGGCEAQLLIGDKVVCEEPPGFEHQLDLGAAWKEMTGLPFVFATWMTREGVDLGDLPERLERSKREGLRHVEQIIAQHAISRGWPAGVALQYLTCYLKYDIGETQIEAMRRFHELSGEYGVVEGELRELRLYAPVSECRSVGVTE